MAWAKLDDQFSDHAKVWARSDAAFRLHVAGVCFAARLLTDGMVPADRVAGLVPNFRRKALLELVDAGMWHVAGHSCERCIQPPETAYVIHDYLDQNPSKEKVVETRAAAVARQHRFRNRGSNAVTDAVTNASRNGSPTRPDPTHKENPPSESDSRPTRAPVGGGDVYDQAARLLAEQEATRRGTAVSNPNGYIGARIPAIRKDHEDAWSAIIEREPNTTAAQLVATLDQQPTPGVGSLPPDQSTVLRHVIRDTSCPLCQGAGIIELEDGTYGDCPHKTRSTTETP